MGRSDPDLVAWAFSADGSATTSLRRLATELIGSDLGRIELIRRGSNVVLRAPEAHTILRLHHADQADAVANNLVVVSQLHAAGAPLVPPLRPQAARTDQVVLTAWPLATAAPTETAAAGLGMTLAALHHVPVPSVLPSLSVADRIARRLDELPSGLPIGVVAALRDHAGTAIAVLTDATTTSAGTVLHGDAHGNNLMMLGSAPRLIDLDDLCRGPREFDLVPSRVSYQRFHRDAARWEGFKAAYGSAADWDLVDALTVVRETTMNTWLAGLWTRDPRARDELARRVRTWDTDWAEHEPWQAR